MDIVTYLNTAKPLQVFEKYSGRKVNDYENLLIDVLLFHYQLQPCVVNVLLSFVLLKQGGKLPRPYVEKIASHWSQANIFTVNEAMEMAKKDYSHISRNKVKSI
jgi:replication initiation and membrane attachment protein